jgi:alkylated DNA nucleotide flippase Atl1
LAAKEIVEIVDGSAPQRFRLAVTHRRDRVLRLSRQIRSGEWTTYGDFSIAVYDNSRMASTIARIAGGHPAFSMPHRILQAGGTVSPEWHDEERRRDPEECKRRLEREGVWLHDENRANPAKFIGWEELRRRLTAAADDEDMET